MHVCPGNWWHVNENYKGIKEDLSKTVSPRPGRIPRRRYLCSN